jgi:hypothetical protein
MNAILLSLFLLVGPSAEPKAESSAEPKVSLSFSNGARFMASSQPQYPLRIDNNVSIKVGDLWAMDILHYDRALVNEPNGKPIPLNKFNNRVFVGYSIWQGLGPVYQRQDITGKESTDLIGVGWLFKFEPIDGLKFSNTLLATKSLYTDVFRFDEVLSVKFPLGFWLSNSLAVDVNTKPSAVVSNKMYVGYEAVQVGPMAGSVVVGWSSSTIREPMYTLGFEVKVSNQFVSVGGK